MFLRNIYTRSTLKRYHLRLCIFNKVKRLIGNELIFMTVKRLLCYINNLDRAICDPRCQSLMPSLTLYCTKYILYEASTQCSAVDFGLYQRFLMCLIYWWRIEFHQVTEIPSPHHRGIWAGELDGSIHILLPWYPGVGVWPCWMQHGPVLSLPCDLKRWK